MSNVDITNIRKGLVDINNQDLFFSILIKGLLLNLDNELKIRNENIPHFILHTGDDTMFLNMKNYKYSTNNDENIYNVIPRCMVNPHSIDILSDQLSNPYTLGQLQYDNGKNIYSLCGEFRRMPLKLSCDLKYYTDSYTDMLNLIQQIITKLSFIRTYYITYMGQSIICSYKLPDTFNEEHLMEIDGTTNDNKNKTLSLSIEIETSIPIWNEQTIMSNDVRIYSTEANIKIVSTNEIS